MRAETAFKLVGDLIGIDAVIVGPTGRADVTLILDPAAVTTTVVPSVAESTGYTPAHRVSSSVTRTAAAEEHGYSSVLKYRRSGSRCRTIVWSWRTLYGIDGLLGINFLRHFNIEIRFADRQIFVENIPP